MLDYNEPTIKYGVGRANKIMIKILMMGSPPS
jgi:hypothetical protein